MDSPDKSIRTVLIIVVCDWHVLCNLQIVWNIFKCGQTTGAEVSQFRQKRLFILIRRKIRASSIHASIIDGGHAMDAWKMHFTLKYFLLPLLLLFVCPVCVCLFLKRGDTCSLFRITMICAYLKCPMNMDNNEGDGRTDRRVCFPTLSTTFGDNVHQQLNTDQE